MGTFIMNDIKVPELSEVAKLAQQLVNDIADSGIYKIAPTGLYDARKVAEAHGFELVEKGVLERYKRLAGLFWAAIQHFEDEGEEIAKVALQIANEEFADLEIWIEDHERETQSTAPDHSGLHRDPEQP